MSSWQGWSPVATVTPFIKASGVWNGDEVFCFQFHSSVDFQLLLASSCELPRYFCAYAGFEEARLRGGQREACRPRGPYETSARPVGKTVA